MAAFGSPSSRRRRHQKPASVVRRRSVARLRSRMPGWPTVVREPISEKGTETSAPSSSSHPPRMVKRASSDVPPRKTRGPAPSFVTGNPAESKPPETTTGALEAEVRMVSHPERRPPRRVTPPGLAASMRAGAAESSTMKPISGSELIEPPSRNPGALSRTGPELVRARRPAKRTGSAPPNPNEAPCGSANSTVSPIVGTGTAPSAQLAASFQLREEPAPLHVSARAAAPAAKSRAAAVGRSRRDGRMAGG